MAESSWKDIVKTVAPVLGTALGGPLGGMATKVIASAVLGEGGAQASVKEVAEAIASGGPEVLQRLKQAEHDFAIKMEELGIRAEEIAAQDRASARDREIRTGDKTTRNLAYITLFGFFLVLAGQFVIGFHFSDPQVKFSEAAQRMLDITTGVLFAMVLAVKDYYFGSSAGSKSKTDLMAMAQERASAAAPPARAAPPAPAAAPAATSAPAAQARLKPAASQEGAAVG